MSNEIQQDINTTRLNTIIQTITAQRNAALDEVVTSKADAAVLTKALENQMEVSKRLSEELAVTRDLLMQAQNANGQAQAKTKKKTDES